MSTAPRKVALLTAGGLAPCLSAAVADLIEHWTAVSPETEIIAYRGGYAGLLRGDSVTITPEVRRDAARLRELGGSPIRNSRVKLTNVKDCVKRGLVREGEDPQEVAARQLTADGVEVLHTIGGDDTNTAAADLAAHLETNGYTLRVVGMPKTIDNDIIPIAQSLGAWTAADEGARFFANVVNEYSANPRSLIVHEIMGRSCGWLAAATALSYRQSLDGQSWLEDLDVTRAHRDVHAVFVPEIDVDIEREAARLRTVMDTVGNVNVFLSEGAGVSAIVENMRATGQEVPVDPFGHVKIDQINPGQWFAQQFAPMIGAEKVLVQKSGYFARSAPANARDLALIKECAQAAVAAAIHGVSGLIGHDEERGGELRAVEFPRVKGGKAFDAQVPWFQSLLQEIGQA
jgi:pyrophosphate--fructose-6-phosphate 1-phosphotransferase